MFCFFFYTFLIYLYCIYIYTLYNLVKYFNNCFVFKCCSRYFSRKKYIRIGKYVILYLYFYIGLTLPGLPFTAMDFRCLIDITNMSKIRNRYNNRVTPRSSGVIWVFRSWAGDNFLKVYRRAGLRNSRRFILPCGSDNNKVIQSTVLEKRAVKCKYN